MRMKKRVFIALMFALAVLVFSSPTFPVEIGCCINTYNVAESSVCAEGVSEETCCNSNTVGEGGPPSLDVCKADYFKANTCDSFSQTPAPCDLGCCCKGAETLSDSRISRVLCTLKKQGDFKIPDNPSIICKHVCEGVNVVCGDGACTTPEESPENCIQDCPVSSDCLNPTYVPKLTELTVNPVQGTDDMDVSWIDECAANIVKYTISRCSAADCKDIITFPPITDNHFIDVNVPLFNISYTYKIKAEYNNNQKSEVTGTGSLGDLECLGQSAGKKFCIQPSYYLQTDIKAYLDRTGTVPNADNYNAGFQCQAGNKLTLIRTCSEGNACSSAGGEITCVVGGTACNPPEGNPFGLYYTRENCEGEERGEKRCFLDRSITAVNTCYPCFENMVCYDYKTSASCRKDNCMISGSQGCKWADIIPSLGIGVCYDPAIDNCDYCSMQGTAGAPNLAAFNTIYDVCTQEKLMAMTENKGCGCTQAGQTEKCPKDHPEVGKCKTGTRKCNADLTWSKCDGVVYPDLREDCTNDIDDDCNGIVNDNCAETICDGNDNNHNNLVDEGFPDFDRDNDKSCDFKSNPLLCGADCKDMDRDGDNVINTTDVEPLTPLGCFVYNESNTATKTLWGKGIDNDGDKVCLGVDCSDVNKSISTGCTDEQVCSNNFKDKGEEEVDCGGLKCKPCKVKDMQMLSPKFSIASNNTFKLKLITNRPGTCRYSLDVDSSYLNKKDFETTGVRDHIITAFKDITDRDAVHKLYVKCTDDYWKDDADLIRFAFNLSVDTTMPQFHPENPKADPNPVIQILPGKDKPQTNLLVYTDDPSICKYGQVGGSFGALDKEFDGYSNNSFNEFHQKTIALPADPKQKDYDYYIGCKNAADPELVSDIFKRVISVDLLQKIALADHTRKFFAGPSNDPVVLNISSQKITDDCFWGESSDYINNRYSAGIYTGSGYSYTQTVDKRLNGSSLVEGNYDYYSICMEGGDKSAILTHQIIIDKTPPTKPIVNDSSKYNDSKTTYVTYELQLRLTSEDNASGIDYFLYRLEDSKKSVILNNSRTDKNNEAFFVTSLNLTNGETYYFFAKAYDLAGLVSEEGKSGGIKVDTSKKPASCEDGIKNGDESALDCGGSCGGCNLNTTCRENDDCLSKSCSKAKIPFVCIAASCEDNTKNGNEADTDCGGSCTAKCGVGKSCLVDKDCLSPLKCDASSKRCTGINTCSNNYQDPSETDVDCGGEECDPCKVNSNCKIDSDCSSSWCNPEDLKCSIPSCTDGIKNGDEAGKDCGGSCNSCGSTAGKGDRDSDGLDDEWEDKYCNGSCNPDDDLDNDELTNIEEYGVQSDPTEEDTDNDGYTDREEVDAGTDPTDPDDHPEGSLFLTFLLVLGILAVLFVGGYAFYTYYYLPKIKGRKPSVTPLAKPPARMPVQFAPPRRDELVEREEEPIIAEKPMPQLSEEQEKRRQQVKELLEKRRAEREAARRKVFEVFGIKEEAKKPKEEQPPKLKEPLKEIKPKKEEPKKEPKRESKKPVKTVQKKMEKKPVKGIKKIAGKESAFERLSKIAKK